MPAMQEVLLERMSWPAIEDAIETGYRRAIICAASTEQHGPHLPEGTDAFLGEEYARRLALKLGHSLVAPIIRPGCSDHHMAFPGSLTVPATLLMDLLDCYVDSLEHHGFERFAVIASHGGNHPVLAEWSRSRPRANCAVLSGLGWAGAGQEALRTFGRTGEGGPHADVLETSMMLVLHPDLVDMSKAEPGFQGEATFEDLLTARLRDVTPNGILGNPVGATAEMGEAALAAIAEAMAAEVMGLETAREAVEPR
jgi:creatinine amidohydrolase